MKSSHLSIAHREFGVEQGTAAMINDHTNSARFYLGLALASAAFCIASTHTHTVPYEKYPAAQR